MPDERIIQMKEERRTWQRVFCNTEGEAVLLALLNRLGYFSSDPSYIDPKSISHANWLLNQIGIVSPQNLPRLSNMLAAASSFADIDALEKAMKEDEPNV